MAKNKRLFIFASYDVQGIVDDTLLHYVSELNKIGDVIFIMDSVATDEELNKIRALGNVVYANAVRHNEYDFGSYKRGYQYAVENKLFDNYDWVYFANDSVYGPLWDLLPVLQDLESRGVDFTGMIDFENLLTPVQLQSWFLGFSKKLIQEQFLNDFMNRICHQTEKQLIVLKYEVGLSRLIMKNGYKFAAFVTGQIGEVCHAVYEKPMEILKAGIPFLKKNGLENIGGLQYLYPYTTEKLVDSIHKNAIRTGISTIVRERKPQYITCFRISVVGLPIVRIKSQKSVFCNTVNYKAFLFDLIPVCKISVTPRRRKL